MGNELKSFEQQERSKKVNKAVLVAFTIIDLIILIVSVILLAIYIKDEEKVTTRNDYYHTIKFNAVLENDNSYTIKFYGAVVNNTSLNIENVRVRATISDNQDNSLVVNSSVIPLIMDEGASKKAEIGNETVNFNPTDIRVEISINYEEYFFIPAEVTTNFVAQAISFVGLGFCLLIFLMLVLPLAISQKKIKKIVSTAVITDKSNEKSDIILTTAVHRVICEQCGTKYPDSMTHCPNCGASQVKK